MIAIQNLAEKVDSKFKMAAMSIYGKKHSNDFFSRINGLSWQIFCKKQWANLADIVQEAYGAPPYIK